MGHELAVTLPPPMKLAARHELTLLQRVPPAARSPTMLARIAEIQLEWAQFDAAIAACDAIAEPDRTYAIAQLQAQAHLARAAPGDDALAAAALDRAALLAKTVQQQAGVLVEQSRIASLADDTDLERALLTRALELDPPNRAAFRRLAALDLKTGGARALLQRCDTFIAKGIAHSRVLGARTRALAATGDIDGAAAAQGVPGGLFTTDIAAPAGWPSLAAFNADLAAEIQTNPDLRDQHHGFASLHSWRLDRLHLRSTRAVAALMALIADFAGRCAGQIPDGDDLLQRTRPASGQLTAWCVISDGAGYEDWHAHGQGWISGVYYVAVPETISTGDSSDGCFEFGLPPSGATQAGTDALTSRVRPRPGLLMVAPSHAWHRTYPYQGTDRRIAVAFDILPADPTRIETLS